MNSIAQEANYGELPHIHLKTTASGSDPDISERLEGDRDYLGKGVRTVQRYEREFRLSAVPIADSDPSLVPCRNEWKAGFAAIPAATTQCHWTRTSVVPARSAARLRHSETRCSLPEQNPAETPERCGPQSEFSTPIDIPRSFPALYCC